MACGHAPQFKVGTVQRAARLSGKFHPLAAMIPRIDISHGHAAFDQQGGMAMRAGAGSTTFYAGLAQVSLLELGDIERKKHVEQGRALNRLPKPVDETSLGIDQRAAYGEARHVLQGSRAYRESCSGLRRSCWRGGRRRSVERMKGLRFCVQSSVPAEPLLRR